MVKVGQGIAGWTVPQRLSCLTVDGTRAGPQLATLIAIPNRGAISARKTACGSPERTDPSLSTTAAALRVVKVRGFGRDSMGILAAIG
jgi:hypothetical protein